MSNLRETKERIQSVKNTQKITRAMKMVAAAKVKKAENAVKMSRPFTMELFKMFVEIYNSIEDKNFDKVISSNPLDNYPVLLKERPIKTLGLLIVSSNKGLAGAYTANLVRFVSKEIKNANKNGVHVRVYIIGTKIEAPLNALMKDLDFDIKEVYTGVLDDINASSARAVALDLAEEYVKNKIDKIELVTTRYINMMNYKVEGWTLFPVINTKDENIRKFFKDEFNQENKIEYKTFFKYDKTASQLFEPSQKILLQKIVPMYITNAIFQALLEAQSSELASRMTAMSAAVNNANEMINALTVEYNKVRQQNITQEITEVISGSLDK
ncbi:MAG: ATP synthase F1 subunit gamma [Candidatus Gastranaerophilales bacterium]|nr:ATP synthase F1 subunit gamma [Candidatus Gastranaerophilales bacterium]